MTSDLTDFIKLAFEAVSFVGSAVVVVWKLSSAITKFELIGTQQATEISSIKISLEKMEAVVSVVAVEKTRMDNQADRISQLDARMENRLNRMEALIDDMRHGRSFVIANEFGGRAGGARAVPP
jgi:hypothetical protein